MRIVDQLRVIMGREVGNTKCYLKKRVAAVLLKLGNGCT